MLKVHSLVYRICIYQIVAGINLYHSLTFWFNPKSCGPMPEAQCAQRQRGAALL